MWLQKIVFICLLSSVYCDVEKILSDLLIELDKTCITEKSIKFYDPQLIEAFGQCRTSVRVVVFEEAFQHEFQDICQKDKVKFCHDIALDKFGVCLNDAQRNHLNYDKEVQKGIVDILCKDDRKLAKKFDSLDNPPCPYEKQDLQDCMNRKPITYDELYTENGCAELGVKHRCLVTRYKEYCKDKEITKFFVDQGRCELRKTPCRQYMRDGELYEIFNDTKIHIDQKCVDDSTDEIDFAHMADQFKGCTSEVRINEYIDPYLLCHDGNVKWCQDIILDKFAACLNSYQSPQLWNDTSDQKEIVKRLCENDSVLAKHFSRFFLEMRKAQVDEMCVNSITDAIDFLGLLGDLQGCKIGVVTAELDKFFEIHCSTKDGKLCRDITLEHFEICLNDSQKIYFQYKRNEQITVTDVICEAGEKFANDEKNGLFSNCQIGTELKEKCGKIKLDSLEDIASDNCRMQKEGFQCVANTFKNCTSKGMYDVFTETGRRLFKLPPCGDVGVRSCSLNSVLFIAMLLCLKYFVF